MQQNMISDSLRHYLERARYYAEMIAETDAPEKLLRLRLAPDMEDTGFHLAVAMGFAARALAPPSGRDVPEVPQERHIEAIRRYGAQVSELIAPISDDDLVQTVSHRAGEAQLRQGPQDYVLRFALPNLVFHLSMTHAGLRHSGLALGKADFDGLHHYS